jgi:protein-tyrosine phosphatase
MRTIFWLESLKGRDHLQNLVVDGKDNIRMYHKEEEWKIVEWMHLAHSTD